MNEKKINARFTPKGDTEAKWKKATGFVPLDKEVIIYKPDENYSYSRIKIGDGVTGVNDLPFVSSQPDYDDEDVMETLTDLQLVTPLTLNDGSVLISNNNEIICI